MITLVIVLGALCLFLMLSLRLMVRLNSALRAKADRYESWAGEYKEERDDFRDELAQLRSRYKTLQSEYDRVAELENGEDYVRQSLGYPADKDQGEST